MGLATSSIKVNLKALSSGAFLLFTYLVFIFIWRSLVPILTLVKTDGLAWSEIAQLVQDPEPYPANGGSYEIGQILYYVIAKPIDESSLNYYYLSSDGL